MPNTAKALKERKIRIGHKEAATGFMSLHETSVTLREAVADFRKHVALFKKENKQLQAQTRQIEASQSNAPEEPAGRVWISGKVVKSLRKRVGLTQADFAKLVGISHQTVFKWEQKPGMLRLLSFA